LALAGYNVVIQSTRGRHGSEGCFIPFINEEDDGAAALDWCCEAPWADGRVFLMGKSYEGFTAWAATRRRHPGVAGLAVSMTTSRLADWFYESGAFRQSFAQSWGLSLAYTDASKPDDEFRRIRHHARHLEQLYSIEPESSPLLEFLPGYSLWLSEKRLAEIGAGLADERTHPIHLVTGWNDVFVRGAIADVRTHVPGDRLIVGPWSHDTVGERVVGQTDYSVWASTGEFDVTADRLLWMESVLCGTPRGGVSYFVVGSNHWEERDQWFPATRDHTLELFGEDPSPTVILRRDVRVRTPGGRVHDPLLPLAGGFRFEDVMNQEGAVILRSPALSCSRGFVGAAVIEVTVACSERFPLIAWLASYSPQAGYFPLSTGGCCVSAAATPHRVALELSEVAAQVPAGSELVVGLSCSSWPEFYSPPPCPTSAQIVSNEGVRLTLQEDVTKVSGE